MADGKKKPIFLSGGGMGLLSLGGLGTVTFIPPEMTGGMHSVLGFPVLSFLKAGGKYLHGTCSLVFSLAVRRVCCVWRG